MAWTTSVWADPWKIPSEPVEAAKCKKPASEQLTTAIFNLDSYFKEPGNKTKILFRDVTIQCDRVESSDTSVVQFDQAFFLHALEALGRF